ncbi:hypothetical protein PM082_022432 [Marasmius tenuissimus]|nr:hypothetical protein PM082_022432 [Marasmius tenuissimus]
MIHEPLFHLLIEYGADVTTTILTWFNGKVNLLQIAAGGQHNSRPGLAIPEYLIPHDLPVNPPVEDGSGSAFAFAILKQDFSLGDRLLEHAANMDLTSTIIRMRSGCSTRYSGN